MLILVDCKKKRMRNKAKSAQKNWSSSASKYAMVSSKGKITLRNQAGQ